MDDSFRRECYQATNVSKYPDHAFVEEFVVREVFVTIKLL